MSQPRTVLVAEDDPDLLSAIELLLHRRGYQVLTAADGLHAVELAEQQPVDVALVDLLMPGQSGFQVATDLKARHGDAVRVILMSGNVSAAHVDYAFAAGAERFLPKPFTSTQLFDAIAAFCPPPEVPSDAHRAVRIGS